MKIITNEKINFNSLEENTYKKMMKLGREIIQEDLKMLDNLIKEYRDKEMYECKDIQPTTIKSKLGEIPIMRRRYKMLLNGKVKYIYLLDEFLQINEIGLYSQSIIEMVTREITKKSYRETAKTISEDTGLKAINSDDILDLYMNNETKEHSINVDNNLTSVTLDIVTNSDYADLKLSDEEEYANKTITRTFDLTEDETTFTVDVKAENGNVAQHTVRIVKSGKQKKPRNPLISRLFWCNYSSSERLPIISIASPNEKKR